MLPSLGYIAKSLPTSSATVHKCSPTAHAIRGPLYRSNAPWRTRLCPLNEPGEALSIRGTITGSIDCRPIPGVTLDIWQTNAKGLYSNLFGFEDQSQPDTFNLRGRLMSDEHGHYQFESILPGRYPLFWPLTRPRHIHLSVTHPQCEPLTTQIYFEGDRYNRWDPWWLASLTIRLEHVTKSGLHGYRGLFDITLQQVTS
jgi:protocatechuate 3,4-dioxygenase beta subunit